MKFPKIRENKKLPKVLTRSGIICKVFFRDGFLQMVSCTSEIIIPWYKNILVMYIEREEWLSSDVSKYSKLCKRPFPSTPEQPLCRFTLG